MQPEEVKPPLSGRSRVAVLLSALLCQLQPGTASEQQHGAPTNNTQHPQDNINIHPCMPSKWDTAFDTFLKRHLPADQPSSLDQNQWERFIRQHKLCKRPTQSFLRPQDEQQVLEVCSAAGGRALENNLCISGQEFSFTTVRTHRDCTIKQVKAETKHIILACDEIQGRCRPIHFQGNPEDLEPDQNREPPCERPQSSGTEWSAARWLSLLWPLWY